VTVIRAMIAGVCLAEAAVDSRIRGHAHSSRVQAMAPATPAQPGLPNELARKVRQYAFEDKKRGKKLGYD
jgi:hypothetical protein